MSDADYIKKLEAENAFLKSYPIDVYKENNRRRMALIYTVCKFYQYLCQSTGDSLARERITTEMLKANSTTQDVLDIMLKGDKHFFENVVSSMIGSYDDR